MLIGTSGGEFDHEPLGKKLCMYDFSIFCCESFDLKLILRPSFDRYSERPCLNDTTHGPHEMGSVSHPGVVLLRRHVRAMTVENTSEEI